PCLTDGAHTMQELPQRFADVGSLEHFLSEPPPALAADLERIDGDILVLGVGGKMGPTLARMARRAAPDRRVIGVARFSDPATRASLEAHGVECIACDLLDRTALERLPNVADGVRNVVFMAGHKFGAAGNASLTWMMNVGVPMNVAEVYREARIVAFSTACVYPFVPVDGPGADESVAPNPPAGDYANSCVGRERMFEYGSQKWGTPGRPVRLSFPTDMRFRGVRAARARPHDGLRRRHLAGRRERAVAAPARALHVADDADQHHGTRAHEHPLARRTIRRALRTRTALRRQRSAHRLARGHDRLAAPVRQAARAARTDDRLDRRLDCARRREPRQADAFRDARWPVLTRTAKRRRSKRSMRATCRARSSCRVRRRGTRTRPTGGRCSRSVAAGASAPPTEPR